MSCPQGEKTAGMEPGLDKEVHKDRKTVRKRKQMNYKMIVGYDGTRYDGWQKQGNTDRTIQGKLEEVLSRLTGEPVEIQGAGRTDAGVHAKGQTANVMVRSL